MKEKQKEKEKEIKVPFSRIEEDNVFTTSRIGWNRETHMPMILVNKTARNTLNVREGDVVLTRIYQGERIIPAIIHKQFYDLVYEKTLCSINTAMSNILGVNMGEKIEVIGLVGESHKNKAFQAIKDELLLEMQKLQARMQLQQNNPLTTQPTIEEGAIIIIPPTR